MNHHRNGLALLPLLVCLGAPARAEQKLVIENVTLKPHGDDTCSASGANHPPLILKTPGQRRIDFIRGDYGATKVTATYKDWSQFFMKLGVGSQFARIVIHYNWAPGEPSWVEVTLRAD